MSTYSNTSLIHQHTSDNIPRAQRFLLSRDGYIMYPPEAVYSQFKLELKINLLTSSPESIENDID